MSETNQPYAGETCSASRHVLAMAVDIEHDGHCQHIIDEPKHCAESMRATVEALWAARREANAMVQPDIADVERLLDEVERNVRGHAQDAKWAGRLYDARTALLDAVRAIAAERDALAEIENKITASLAANIECGIFENQIQPAIDAAMGRKVSK